MRELAKQFQGKGEVSGYDFKQMKRSEYAYLYEVSGELSTHYEVFQKVENIRFGLVSYPRSKAFGKTAYTVGKIERANELFTKLTEHGNTKKTSKKNRGTHQQED